MRKQATEIVLYRCPHCHLTFPIPRKTARKRESGHNKDIWCPVCATTVTMTQKDE